jgi:hypothetical protein
MRGARRLELFLVTAVLFACTAVGQFAWFFRTGDA